MKIRPAGSADLEVLLRMAGHFLASTSYGRLVGAVAPFQLEWFIEAVLARGIVLLAELDGQALGFIALQAQSHPVNGQLYAGETAWWVEPAHRHSRVGRQLLEAAEVWAIARGLSLLQMVAPADSEVGTFYARMGYAPVETSYQKALVP